MEQSARVLGREAELSELAGMLAAARHGHSAALLIRGEPGVGKTTLLQEFTRRATGATIVSTAGIASESDVTFSSLADLLVPLAEHLSQLASHQREALAGALALGSPVPSDPLTLGAATLSLIAAAAERQPVVVLVDDLQWIDGPSRRMLHFAARRLRTDGIVMLFAARDDADPLAGVEQLLLTGLDQNTSRLLVETCTNVPVSPTVAAGLHRHTGGNPLALITASSRLSTAELTGDQPFQRPLDVGRALTETLGAHLSDMPEPSRRALLVVAATQSRNHRLVRASLAELGIGEDALVIAEQHGIVDLGGPIVRFRHPLLRSAIYHRAEAAERRAVHAAIAAAAVESPDEERSWHLAAAATGPDEQVARALESTAQEALQRSGYAVAATALEQAAEFSIDEPHRIERLLGAAQAAQTAGRSEHALTLLERALERAEASDLRAQGQHLRALIGMWLGNPEVNLALLQEEARRIEAEAPAEAALMLSTAAMQAPLAGRAPIGLKLAERAVELAPSPTTIAALGAMRMYSGEEAEARRLLLEAAPTLATATPGSHEQVLAVFAAFSLAWLYEHDDALRLVEPVLDAARSVPVMATMPLPLIVRAEVNFRRGHWARALADAEEARGLADEFRQRAILPFTYALLAVLEAVQGKTEASEHHCVEASTLADALGLVGTDLFVERARGFAALGAGRSDEAVAHFERVRLITERVAIPSVVVGSWRENLLEAYVREGREDEARHLLEEFQRRAEAAQHPYVFAVLHRCRALLEPEEADAAFPEALRWHLEMVCPFERARTELAYGEYLHRSERRGEARRHLRSAMTAFQDLGAVPWIERTAAALRASGEPVSRDQLSLHDLTPQELQVALTVAEGATNREAAAALFLSAKTIEHHLGNVYRKLGIRSRSELVKYVWRSSDPGAQEGR